MSALAMTVILFLWSSAYAIQELRIENVDSTKWPIVKLEISLPTDHEVKEEYNLQILPTGSILSPTSLIRLQLDSNKNSLVIAIDSSRSLTSGHLDSIRRVVADHVQTFSKDEDIALLTFNDNVQILTGFTDDKSNIENSIKAIRPAGSKTELYKAMLTGIDLLKNIPGNRAMLVISDGHDEGQDITREQVVKAAIDNKITISAVGIPENSKNANDYLALLESLTKETKGKYKLSDSLAALPSAVYILLQANRNERPVQNKYICDFTLDTASAALQEPFKAILTRKSGTDTQSLNFDLNPPYTPPKQMTYLEIAQETFRTYPWLWACVATLFILPCIFIILMRRKKANPPEENVALNLQSVEAPSASPFVIEFSELGLSFPLGIGIMTIGANPDNAIIVNEPTVSGRHAELKVSDKECRITDLNSTNGVLVNGERIRRAMILKAGDKVDLGRAAGVLRLVKKAAGKQF
jgi:hypothetical protein